MACHEAARALSKLSRSFGKLSVADPLTVSTQSHYSLRINNRSSNVLLLVLLAQWRQKRLYLPQAISPMIKQLHHRHQNTSSRIRRQNFLQTKTLPNHKSSPQSTHGPL